MRSSPPIASCLNASHSEMKIPRVVAQASKLPTRMTLFTYMGVAPVGLACGRLKGRSFRGGVAPVRVSQPRALQLPLHACAECASRGGIPGSRRFVRVHD